MTRLVLIRHGQTDWNLDGRYQGQADPPLNAAGWAQAGALARQLAGRRFAALYSSDLRRARDTARVIADSLELSVTIDKRLREINQGEWEGMLPGDIMARYPGGWAAREADPVNARAPGGESVADVAARVPAAAAEIARAHPGGAVLIVSHGLALATLLCRVRGVPLNRARELILENARPEWIEW